MSVQNLFYLKTLNKDAELNWNTTHSTLQTACADAWKPDYGLLDGLIFGSDTRDPLRINSNNFGDFSDGTIIRSAVRQNYNLQLGWAEREVMRNMLLMCWTEALSQM